MKYKKTFFAVILALIIVSVAFFAILDAPPPAASVAESKTWLSGWSYRMSHEVAGSPGAGADYQIKINVHYRQGVDSGSNVYLDSKCQRNFNDVRFTSSDGITILDYWIENKTEGDSAVFWVKVNDNLDSNQTIYIYYGNSNVSSASNIYSTFPFADDFQGSSLNTTKWTTYGSGKITVSGGQCILESNPGDYGWIYMLGNTLVGTNYAVRFSTQVIEQGVDRWTHHGFATIFNSSTQGGRIDEYPNYITVSQEAQFYSWSLRNRAYANTSRVDLSDQTPAAGAFNTYEIQRNGTSNVILTCNDNYQASLSINVPTVTMGAMFGADNAGSQLYSVTAIHWVVIRKYVSNEPLQGVWGTEENSPSGNFFENLAWPQLK